MGILTAPGVIGSATSCYIGMEEAREYLGCSKNKAYEVLRGLRKELIDSGKLYPKKHRQGQYSGLFGRF